jgi:hypothetical protein
MSGIVAPFEDGIIVGQALMVRAQRLGVQRAAGRDHIDRSEMLFAASGCQNRRDPAAPLQRRVSPLPVFGLHLI